MPSIMAIMAFAAFADIDCCFNFKSNAGTAITIFANKIGIFLIVIVFIGGTYIH